MKSFKNLLIVAGTLCAVASAASVHALEWKGGEVTGCAAVWTGGIANTFPNKTETNYYDVYCGDSAAKSKSERTKEVNKEIERQINKRADRGWKFLHTNPKTYNDAVNWCRGEYAGKTQKSYEKHYSRCY